MHSQFSQLRLALVGPHKCLMSPNKGVLRNFRNWKPKLWHFGMARPTHRQHAQLICKQLTHLPISVENNLPYAFPQICETSLPSCFHFFFFSASCTRINYLAMLCKLPTTLKCWTPPHAHPFSLFSTGCLHPVLFLLGQKLIQVYSKTNLTFKSSASSGEKWKIWPQGNCHMLQS